MLHVPTSRGGLGDKSEVYRVIVTPLDPAAVGILPVGHAGRENGEGIKALVSVKRII
jgi:hypothetical protein